MIMLLADLVKGWDWGVIAGSILCVFRRCPYCGGQPDAFKVHDRPRRWFWAVVGDVVEKVRGRVIQWKCPFCLRTFRQLPEWGEPFKRYVSATVTGLGWEYLEEDWATYRGVARQAHADPLGIAEGLELSHVTLWRWVGALGEKTDLLANARSLIRQKDPNCPMFRELVDVPERKYRSQARRGILIQAKQLLRTAGVYLQVFGVPLFHEFGTAGP
jgi:hypothetical protein